MKSVELVRGQPQRLSSFFSTGLAALIGAGTALAAATLLGRQPAPDRHPLEVVARPTRAPVVREKSPPDGRLAALERTVSSLQRRAEEDRAESKIDDGSSDLGGQAELGIEEDIAEYEARFDADAPVTAWSRDASQKLRGGLDGLAASDKFLVMTAECKAEWCRASVQFANHDEARRHYAALAESALPGLNCTQTAMVQPARTPEAPLTALLYLDCSSQQSTN